MDRVCDEFLTCAGFSLNQHGGTHRRDAFDLFQYCFQRRTIAYDLLESAVVRILIPRSPCPSSCHSEPPLCCVHASYRAQLIGSTLESRSDTFEQGLIVEWSCHELYCACS